MARAELGPIVSSISGSVAGVTFNRRPGTTCLYGRPLPGRHATHAQLFHRQAMTTAATDWGAMSEAYRKAWNTFAKQEQIPSFFSRGRKWTGRQLYFCFSLAASHQYTPLPVGWLPRSPLFFQTSLSYISVLFPKVIPEDPPDPEYTYGEVLLQMNIPLSLNPGDPDGTTNRLPACFWLAVIPLGQRTGPRQFYKVAPLPWNVFNYDTGLVITNTGNTYSNWNIGLDSVLGPLRGVNYADPADQPRPYDVVFRCQGLSNHRLYFTAPFFCNGTHFAGVTPAQTANINAAPPLSPPSIDFQEDTFSYPGNSQPWEP